MGDGSARDRYEGLRKERARSLSPVPLSVTAALPHIRSEPREASWICGKRQGAARAPARYEWPTPSARVLGRKALRRGAEEGQTSREKDNNMRTRPVPPTRPTPPLRPLLRPLLQLLCASALAFFRFLTHFREGVLHWPIDGYVAREKHNAEARRTAGGKSWKGSEGLASFLVLSFLRASAWSFSLPDTSQ